MFFYDELELNSVFTAEQQGTFLGFAVELAMPYNLAFAGAYRYQENPDAGEKLNGALHIYRHNEGAWSESPPVVLADPIESGNETVKTFGLGHSLARSGDQLIVGAPRSSVERNGDDPQNAQGSVHIFSIQPADDEPLRLVKTSPAPPLIGRISLDTLSIYRVALLL